MNPQVLSEVKKLVSEHRCIPIEKLHEGQSLEDDLGMTGDDADEFMSAFFSAFPVSRGNYEFSKHFGPEGCLPFVGLFLPKRKAVTLRDLADAVEKGEWTKSG